nr:unnamed protein product [Callosobruchus analis]
MERWEGRAVVHRSVLANLQVAEEEAQQPARRLYKPTDPFTLEGSKFVKLFRLSKVLVRNLIEMLADYLKHQPGHLQ